MTDPASALNPFASLRDAVLAVVAAEREAGRLPADLPLERVDVEPPRDPAHGDAATNAALVLAKPARTNPMALAERLAEALRARPEIASADAARPGFVNCRLKDSVWQNEVRAVLRAGEAYGASAAGAGVRINVEYCSANPTGPLHVGHGRGTVYGDALASLLARMGYDVTREYYLNDGGVQIDTLARSVRHRYLEALGDPVGPVPEGLYPGAYLEPVARAIAAEDGDRWRDAPESLWLPPFRDRAVAAMRALIEDDLSALGVRFDVFTSEARLIAEDRVNAVLSELEGRGLLYTGTLPPPKGKPSDDWEERPQLLFRSTDFGDDADRALKRSTGEWTYFAADAAYHYDKVKRGFDRLINVFGADHGGYVKRLQATVRALSEGRVPLDVRLCQLVNLMDGGKPLKMSKRAGRIVGLRDVVDEVGRDVVRFIMLTRKNDAPLDFDLQAVTEQSRDNPVFYVQYAHARACSVLRNAAEAGIDGLTREALAEADLSPLSDPLELALIRRLAFYPRVLEGAAAALEPHRVAFYLHDVAAAFHGLWTAGRERGDLRFLVDGDPAITRARLALVIATRTVVASGLGLMGVTPLQELH